MIELEEVAIGGSPIVTLRRHAPRDDSRPAFVSAQIAPGRGMMLLSARAVMGGLGEFDVLAGETPARARELLDGGPEDFNGNRSFAFGGAILAPFANRIRGRLDALTRTVETRVLGTPVRLTANGGGRAPGAEQYAIHGLILDAAVGGLRWSSSADADALEGTLRAGDFGGRWPSRTELAFAWTLRPDALTLAVAATNVGDAPLPVGIGWHPYFALPSGRRGQARLHLPTSERVLVNDYDEVLPTGVVEQAAGTAYDFSAPDGRSLCDLYLDDCFVRPRKTAEGHTVCRVVDPAAGYGLQVVATSPTVSAVQTYAPPDRPFVVLEPQINWADPYGDVWRGGEDTGMVVLPPGASTTYEVRLELFTPAA